MRISVSITDVPSAGSGAPLAARLAEYADACNLFDIPDGGATGRRKWTDADLETVCGAAALA
jgi:hypothetical protein